MGAILSAAMSLLKGIPARAWLLLGTVLALAFAQWRVCDVAYTQGETQGAARVQAKFDQWKADQAEANAKALAQEIATASAVAQDIAGILARAAHAVAEAKARTQYVTREVTRVVDSYPELRRCVIPDDLLRLRHEQAQASRAAHIRASEGG